MIIVQLQPDDFGQVRFGYSPLIEAAITYQWLLTTPDNSPAVPPHMRGWVPHARRALHDAHLPYMTGLMSYSEEDHHFITDFLTPTPETTHRDFEGELARLVALTPDLIRDDVQSTNRYLGPNEVRAHFLAYPHDAMLCLADELRFYWARVMAPHWTSVLNVLENDVLYRARQMALVGVPDMLNDMGGELSYAPGEGHLIVKRDKPRRHAPPLEPYPLEGRGLRLAPVVLTTKTTYHQLTPNWGPMVVYQARGVGAWDGAALPEPESQLRAAVGDARARVLTALHDPATTTELAHRLYLTAGAVSQHLTRLGEAGLVEPNRVGGRVYYRLTTRGAGLLTLFEAEAVPDGMR